VASSHRILSISSGEFGFSEVAYVHLHWAEFGCEHLHGII
jgi:hypothetical protein